MKNFNRKKEHEIRVPTASSHSRVAMELLLTAHGSLETGRGDREHELDSSRPRAGHHKDHRAGNECGKQIRGASMLIN